MSLVSLMLLASIVGNDGVKQYIRDNRWEFLVLSIIFVLGCLHHFAGRPPS